MNNSFGIYVHVPYCLQRCTYCDFATYVHDQIMPPSDYFALVQREIQIRSPFLLSAAGSFLKTIYFGGGTPSLVPAELLIGVLQQLRSAGFHWTSDCEITLEINPATVDTRKMDLYLRAGFNRFSVGAQTFNDLLLKSVHREHNAQQTRETLRLLQERSVNYSFDLLFALPGQSLDILQSDLDEVLFFRPSHVSPYCLTVPEGHVLSAGRPEEEDQVQMFAEIHKTLTQAGYDRYEISNYAVVGKESRHNLLYWTDQSYWGLGLSAHSYLQPNSMRFWNPSAIGVYDDQIRRNWKSPTLLPSSQRENLEIHQSLTDFCHTSLRLQRGLQRDELRLKFGYEILAKLDPLIQQVSSEGLLQSTTEGWTLTEKGVLLSNQVFGIFTFLKGELTNSQ